MQTLAGLALAAMVLFTSLGCTPSDEDRLSALEAEVAALKERSLASREELAQVRKNLEAIQDLLKLDRDRARLEQDENTAPPSDEELDAKAKSFVDKNLDRLMEVTKKLLDKMEKELDEQLEKMNEPTPPQGDEI
ncbi:hypothetical protein JCM14722_15280 [Pseudodesulfovibrio portus]|uniref:Uncharacterized protein n=2 Tax=Pseudodesulfovibrio portus TaxID=231439 RepID=A0ABM8ARE3_9BACT|nr:hypothetical protein JCM14722_15280 [Pseudodesulfovibrio portus]